VRNGLHCDIFQVIYTQMTDFQPWRHPMYEVMAGEGTRIEPLSFSAVEKNYAPAFNFPRTARQSNSSASRKKTGDAPGTESRMQLQTRVHGGETLIIAPAARAVGGRQISWDDGNRAV